MVRAGLLAALLISLAACGRDEELGPFADSRTPAELTPRFYPPEGWAWGFVGVGGKPLQRYGVASTPRRVPVANVVIVPGYGETAEVWFETASGLIERGHTVWILDRGGQGGSGRYVAPRDLGHVPSFDPDIAALRELVRLVVKPAPGTPLILLTHGDGAVIALGAVRSGLTASGVVVSSPRVGGPPEGRLLGAVRQPDQPPLGWAPWSAGTPDDYAGGRTHDRQRGRVGQAWMSANPRLRLTGSSVGWNKAFEAGSRILETRAGQIRTPVLMINPQEVSARLCDRAPSCRTQAIPGAKAAIHLEADQWRRPWLSTIEGFIDGQVARQRDAAISPNPTGL